MEKYQIGACPNWEHYSRGATGAFTVNLDDSLCSDCDTNPTKTSICFSFGTTFVDVP